MNFKTLASKFLANKIFRLTYAGHQVCFAQAVPTGTVAYWSLLRLIAAVTALEVTAIPHFCNNASNGV